MIWNNIRYNIINIVVLILTAVLFIYDYRNIKEIFCGENLFSIFILFLTVLVVHATKLGRLYLALSGFNIDFISSVKIYCKVTPVSVVIPFKLGEFFRMYCYGRRLGDIRKGIVVILFDRFMDTAAIVTVILLVGIFGGGHMTSFIFLFLVFLTFVLFIYFVFPGICEFWRKYLLRAKATEQRLAVLEMLKTFNMIYQEIENVAKGKGVILYFISLLSWGIEIGSVAVLNGILKEGELSAMISGYLISAMNGHPTFELQQFVFISISLLTVSYFVLKIITVLYEKKVYE